VLDLKPSENQSALVGVHSSRPNLLRGGRGHGVGTGLRDTFSEQISALRALRNKIYGRSCARRTKRVKPRARQRAQYCASSELWKAHVSLRTRWPPPLKAAGADPLMTVTSEDSTISGALQLRANSVSGFGTWYLEDSVGRKPRGSKRKILTRSNFIAKMGNGVIPLHYPPPKGRTNT
jgi:hypothetical protein